MRLLNKKILVTAVVLACMGGTLGMLAREPKADAAVLVYDQENILQAMKTAINTASILTTAQKQLALQVVDMTSISADQLAALFESQTKSKQTILDENAGKIGALTPNSSASNYWNENFSNIENILNGNMTVMDAYQANQKALKALEKTNQDAIHGAKTTQALQKNMNETIDEALTASANASGTKEAVQANTQTVAATAMGTLYGNNLLSEVLAMQASKYQKEVQDEANAIALQEQINSQIATDVDSMKKAVGVK